MKKALLITIALTAWIAVVFQAYLTTGSFGNLFSYFTILTNLLIAVIATALLAFQKANFLQNPSVQTAIALYIFIVALVYNTVLRGIVALTGWSVFVDTLLHVVVPLLYIAYWFLFVPKGLLQYKEGLKWLLFPFVYLVYTLIRGSIVNWYPYPFVNVSDLGYLKVGINSIILMLVFMLSGFLLIWLDKLLGKRSTD